MDSMLDILLCDVVIVLLLALNMVRLLILRKKALLDAECSLAKRKLISLNLWLTAAVMFFPLMALLEGIDGVFTLLMYISFFVRFEYVSLVLINLVFICILAARTALYAAEKVPEQKQSKKRKLINMYIFALVLLLVVDVTSLLLMGRLLTFVIVLSAALVCICIKIVSYIKNVTTCEQYSVKRVVVEAVSAMLVVIVPIIVVCIWYIIQLNIDL